MLGLHEVGGDMKQTIKIGASIYQIVDVLDLRNDDGTRLSGKVTVSKRMIKVDAENDEQEKRQTLWHETLHVILTQAGRYEHSESEINTLAYGIMSVLDDNPWMAQSGGGK